MLTTREGGAAASAPKHAGDDGEASDVGVNDLGDGGAAMCALRHSQPWEAEVLEICPRGNNKIVIIIFPCS